MGKTPRLFFDDLYGAGVVPVAAAGSVLPLAIDAGTAGPIAPNYSDLTAADVSRGYEGVIEIGLAVDAEAQESAIYMGDNLGLNLTLLKHFQARLNLAVALGAGAGTLFQFGLGGIAAEWGASDFFGIAYAITGTGVHQVFVGSGSGAPTIIPVPLQWIKDGTLSFDLTRGLSDIRLIGSVDARGDRDETLLAFDGSAELTGGAGVQPFISIAKSAAVADLGAARIDSWQWQY